MPAGRSPLRRTVPSVVASGSPRQVARVVAFLFLASVAMVVAITHAWPESEAAIFSLIATGVLLVVLFMDMLPPAALGRWRHPIEGLGAIVLLGLLMAITGGIGSPFIVGFYLVVAGTALSAEGMAPLAIALIAALTVAGVAIVTTGVGSIDAAGLAWIGVTAIGLLLVADLSAAAARAQRTARDEALRASRFDVLTGLFNRAFFATTMEQEIRRSGRMDREFALLMLDLDDLKPVNDTFGHQWGDRLIRSVADLIRQTIRFTDSAARYGGDEFVVLLPETDAAGAYVVAETLRRDIAAMTLQASDRNVRSSVVDRPGHVPAGRHDDRAARGGRGRRDVRSEAPRQEPDRRLSHAHRAGRDRDRRRRRRARVIRAGGARGPVVTRHPGPRHSRAAFGAPETPAPTWPAAARRATPPVLATDPGDADRRPAPPPTAARPKSRHHRGSHERRRPFLMPPRTLEDVPPNGRTSSRPALLRAGDEPLRGDPAGG